MFVQGFIKNRYIARTFIMPGQEMRKKTVRLKLNTIKSEFKDKVKQLAKIVACLDDCRIVTVCVDTFELYTVGGAVGG